MTTELARRGSVTVQATNLDPFKVGQTLASSGFFADTKDAAQAAVKILAGAEIGFGPVASMTGINIIKNRVTLSANLMAAAIKAHPKYSYKVVDLTEDRCVLKFFEDGNEIGESEFTSEDAKTAGLSGDNWRKYRRNMLFARALSNGAKWHCPDAFGGAPVYTPDELGAQVDGESGEMVAPPKPELPANKVTIDTPAVGPVQIEGPSVALVSASDVEELKAACKGLSVQQIKLTMGGQGLPVPEPFDPAHAFDVVPQDAAALLVTALLGAKRPEVVAA